MKKILSLIVCFAMLFTFVSALPASAETTLQTEVGADGKEYYLIGTADDYLAFVTLANADLTINGKLTADIDLTGKTVDSIGTAPGSGQSTETSYQGIFDGDGHVIRNMSISRTFKLVADSSIAMFDMIDGATIKNLGIENSTITNIGGKDGVILSALVGRAYGGTIENCYVKNSSIVSTKNSYNIKAAGPIAAMITNTTYVRNCYAVGNEIGFTESGGTASGGASISKFIGYTSATATVDNIVNCYAKGNTLKNRPSGQKSAGFVRVGSSGDTDMAFTNCYTDSLLNFDSGSSLTKLATDAAEWATLADTLGSAYKNDTFNLNGGAPRLAWEYEPALTEYNVTIAEGITGGTVTADVEKGLEGTEVTLTVTPAGEEFYAESVKVNGEELASPYTFAIGTEDVTVTATFASYWEGEGTENSPFLIKNTDDMNDLRKAVNEEKHFAGKYFSLESDLDFEGVEGYGVIGSIGSNANFDVRYFSGKFNGNNKVIKNLTINASNRYIALFGKLVDAEITNLGIEDSYFRQQGNYYAATLAGYTSNSVISNCYVKNTKVIIKSESSGEAANSQNMGGLIAQTAGTTAISNCYTNGITLQLERSGVYLNGAAGGLVGILGASSTITNSYTADITFTNIGTNGNAAYIARTSGENNIINSYSTARGGKDTAVIVVTETELRAASLLGNGFKTDFYAANGGFPMLAWENTAGLEKDIDFVYAGLVKDGDAISAIKLEKADATALAGKLYAAVFSGDVMNYAKLANVSENSAGVKTITLTEAITLAEGEELRIFVWDNNLNPLMYAVK